MDPINKSLHLSHEFVISCGTVTVDIKRSKVLLIRWRKTGEIMLPKGRKDRSERLEQTALRETFEETGIHAQLLPVGIDTLATPPPLVDAEGRREAATEPIALSQRVDHQGILKVIFWYVAEADSTVTPVDGTQQQDEDFETIWEDFGNVTSTLSFPDDQRIAQAAIGAINKGVAHE
ncbi:nudix domain-containing protein [Fusarium austroafricanum]|uniref:Nudix domain-containing protein n=1 Tax=Fusarium austroafricanum TaxID=2364996 RepID=A0A8H4P221_9HYPO|nr:nudix domain-containing protein [Fusarium austroafricanum]